MLGIVLAGAGRAAVAARLAPGSVGQPLSGERLDEDLLLVRHAGGNVLVLAAPDALTLVDGGLAGHSRELLRLVSREFKGRPVRQLFNTHWHWDHTGSNESLARAGADIYAHENTRLWLAASIDSRWEGRRYAPRPPLAQPNHTFFNGSKQLAFGGGSLEYGYLPQAHTDGDLYVFSATHNLLAAGDVVSGGSYPVLDYATGGWLGGMVAGLRQLLARVDMSTRVVPGSGPVRGKADIQAQLEMCEVVLGRIGESYFKGNGLAAFLATAPTREFDTTWGDPALFLRTAFEGAWGHVTELRKPNR